MGRVKGGEVEKQREAGREWVGAREGEGDLVARYLVPSFVFKIENNLSTFQKLKIKFYCQISNFSCHN